MALNSPCPMNFYQPVLHTRTVLEQDETQVTTAQQDAATLLYMKNREEIWHTDKTALEGSRYSERLEKIVRGDERQYDISVEDYDTIAPPLVPVLDFISPKGYRLNPVLENLEPQVGYFDADAESLRGFEDEVNRASKILERIAQAPQQKNVIPALENAFDRVDDIKVLLHSLNVDQSLGKQKSLILDQAHNLSKAIELAANGING